MKSVFIPSFLLSFSKDLDDKSKWTPGVVQTNTITVKRHMMFWGLKSGHRVSLNKECVRQTAASEIKKFNISSPYSLMQIFYYRIKQW